MGKFKVGGEIIVYRKMLGVCFFLGIMMVLGLFIVAGNMERITLRNKADFFSLGEKQICFLGRNYSWEWFFTK
ncbi:MAG TPA: hypothetical protein GX687_01235 [Clostridia bacterium]|nr:hypothetical protein [Clostridia bacterium]